MRIKGMNLEKSAPLRNCDLRRLSQGVGPTLGEGAMKGVRWIAVFVVVTCAQAFGAVGKVPPPSPQYRHAYYLFLASPMSEGEDRTVPLLLASTALEQMDKGDWAARCVLIDTYERDSVFLVRQGVALAPGDVKPLERHVRIQTTVDPRSQRWHRYQEVSMTEVQRLLEHPEGSIPAHRPATSREELDAILGALKAPEQRRGPTR